MIVECPGCRLRYDLTGRPPGTRMRCRCRHEFVLGPAAADAATLSCPGCGGKSAPTRTRCEYCGNPLASVRCPRCFALAFAGAKHCSACAAPLIAPARAFDDDGSSALRCPRCRVALVAELVGDALLDHCDGCGGLWVDHGVLERVLDARRREPTLEAALGALPPAVTPRTGSRKVVYVRCPECATLMNRKNFGNRSGVIVDVCPSHGIWFDAGELARVVEFVRSGAWERALEAERRAAQAQPPRPAPVMLPTSAASTGSAAEAVVALLARLFG